MFLGVFACQNVLQPERVQIQSGTRSLLVHARPGDGALAERHYQTAPEDREVLEVAAVLRQQMDTAQRGVVRFE